MRPCGATRAGTQAPPLPRSVIFFHAIPYKQNNHLHTILSNEINRPSRNLPKRNCRGGAYVPARTSAQWRFHTKYTCIVCGELNDGCTLVGRHGWAHRRRPYPSPSNIAVCHYPLYIQQSTPIARCAHTPPYCTFDSSKPRGVTLPHRGYTLDSAGLASATQPTLGNDVIEEATPLGVVLFLIAHHYHMRRMDYSPMISPYEN